MLWIKLSTSKDTSLSRIPPSEPSFKQHVFRSSSQATVWMTSHLAKPLIFMDDNTRQRIARIIREFRQQEPIDTFQWPTMSSNINQIEHVHFIVWDFIGRRVNQRNP